MTTLNEMLKIYSPILLSENEDRLNVIKAFEAWLKQKQPFIPHDKTSNSCPECIKQKFLDELLKEAIL